MSNPYVEIREGDKSRNLILTKAQTTIGRQAGVDLVLADNLLSRQHCVIEFTTEGWRVRDLKSRNGTALNGKLISEEALKGGDVIRIGAAFLTFRDPMVVEEEEEMLSADDLVPVIQEAPEPKANKSPLSARMSDDPDQALETLARSLPEQSFAEGDIILYSARGTIMHGAKKGAQKGKRETVDLFRLLLLICIRSRTTDIHLEPHQDSYGIRLRVDGVMADVAKLPQQTGVKMATLVKVLSDIDIAQRNTIQEGRFSSQSPSRAGGQHKIDYRVSFAPAVNGQKLVIRILDEANAPAQLADLQMPRWMERELAEQIRQDAGMVLVAGPTGSGKTTTLYSLLRSIELDQRNVVTIEDPVEMQIDQTTQMPVDEASGKTFSNILRSVLRQDPDVIMLGEIRDAETARTAMQAAITGHMVLSTVHTRDTLGTVFRLLDLGVEPYLVSQGLQIVIAQRLIRILCPFCRRRIAPTPEQKAALATHGYNPEYLYTGVGCLKCLDTGHAGRRAVFELLVSSDRLRDAMQKPGLVTGDLAKAVEGTPFTSLGKSGFQLVVDGIASFEEVERISGRGTRGE